MRVRKEFNREGREDTEKWELAEEVFGGGADDASGRFGRGLVTIAANENNGKTFGFAHEETGGRSKVVFDGEEGGSGRPVRPSGACPPNMEVRGALRGQYELRPAPP